ncbi:MAG TPA: hypothetical protein VK806_04240 [Bacteroidia bacterium]|nr:hypothetical protein [Bacteroidia bacterium]
MTFKIFVEKVIKEGNRLQKFNINGKPLTKSRFTTSQVIGFIIAVTSVFTLPSGFSKDFAGDIIVFLGIFIGLFASIIIAMFDSSKRMFEKFDTATEVEKTLIRQKRNYAVQFTGLTSYSILFALIVIGLLAITLLSEKFNTNIYNYEFITTLKTIDAHAFILFCKVAILMVIRFFIIYLLFSFFIITIFAITSYSTYLLSEYKRLLEK